MLLPGLITAAILLSSPVAAEDSAALGSARALGDAFAEIVDRVGPATVYIQADKARPLSLGLQQLIQDYALPRPRPDAAAGWSSTTGSGVIVREDGLVLTNHHVVSGATGLAVTLWDKRSYPAVVIGSDPRTDLAVLQIEGEGPFPVADIGDSDAIRIGHWVIAIGHPFDFQFTVTAGIVSARGRRNIIPEEIQDYIQTDASINPGNSGGPLFNLDGEVVGINTAIYTPEGGAVQNAGISFAIPSNMAWRISSELMQRGRVARASIGVTTQDVPPTPDSPRPGAQITQVLAESPAEAAGLRRGDIILEVDGERISTTADLRGLILARGPDTTLPMRIVRGGEHLDVVLTTAGRREEAPAPPDDAVTWAGAVLAMPTEARLAHYGVALPEDSAALLVLSVAPDSPAASAGLTPGDLLLQIQSHEVQDLEQFLAVAESHSSVMVWFYRAGTRTLAAIGGL
ncbi:MAG: trypsin-like peptidase domain-containing protein [Myxococcota bacterium]|nr:trypsin-like peptidase domain-containing protein [Myxococcota bacterium]